MGEFVEAGYADRLDGDHAAIHIWPDTYEVTADTLHLVLMYGATMDIHRRIPQTVLDTSGGSEPALRKAGTIALSKTKRSVTVRPLGGRLFVISADALRDVMRGEIPRAAVSEVILKPERKAKTIAA